jgi:hypothetical protein
MAAHYAFNKDWRHNRIPLGATAFASTRTEERQEENKRPKRQQADADLTKADAGLTNRAWDREMRTKPDRYSHNQQH